MRWQREGGGTVSFPGHFTSITMHGPLGHVCTLRAPGVEVECHARTRRDAEESASLALTQELSRRELAERVTRGLDRVHVRRAS